MIYFTIRTSIIMKPLSGFIVIIPGDLQQSPRRRYFKNRLAKFHDKCCTFIKVYKISQNSETNKIVRVSPGLGNLRKKF